MHPTLFQLPWGPANAYGTLILIGGLATVPGVLWDAKARNIAAGARGAFVIDFFLILIAGAVIGGRLAHIVTAPSGYLDDPARIFAVEATGFVFFGSLAGIMGGWAWLARRRGATPAAVLDMAATWLPLGHALGRAGCFFAGCCWGAPSDAAWAVQFPDGAVVYGAPGIAHSGDHTVALHPVQLYEAAGLFVLLGIGITLRLRRGVEPPWHAASRYVFGYGLLRFFTEMFRGDPSRGMLATIRWPPLAELLALPPDQPLMLSVSQAVAIALVALGAWRLRHTRQTGANGS